MVWTIPWRGAPWDSQPRGTQPRERTEMQDKNTTLKRNSIFLKAFYFTNFWVISNPLNNCLWKNIKSLSCANCPNRLHTKGAGVHPPHPSAAALSPASRRPQLCHHIPPRHSPSTREGKGCTLTEKICLPSMRPWGKESKLGQWSRTRLLSLPG